MADSLKASNGVAVVLLATEDAVDDIVGISATITVIRSADSQEDAPSVAVGYCQDRSLEYSLLTIGILVVGALALSLGAILRRLSILPQPSPEADSMYLSMWLLPAGMLSALAIPWLLSIDILELDTIAPHYSAEILTLFGWYVSRHHCNTLDVSYQLID
jgi:hypothetical protein